MKILPGGSKAHLESFMYDLSRMGEVSHVGRYLARMGEISHVGRCSRCLCHIVRFKGDFAGNWYAYEPGNYGCHYSVNSHAPMTKNDILKEYFK